MTRFQPPGDCPVCGEDVPARSKSCPHCGASHDSGWNEEAAYDGLGLPDDAFDHDAFVARELEGKPVQTKNHRLWISMAALLALILVLLWFGILRSR